MTNQVKIKRKATSTERLMFIGITVLIVASFFLPWAKSSAFGFSGYSYLTFFEFLDGMNYYARGSTSEAQLAVLVISCMGIFLSLGLTLIAGIGGWKKFLRIVALLTGICACLLTLSSIGIGGEKAFGYYLTMLCGIALVVLSTKKLSESKSDKEQENETVSANISGELPVNETDTNKAKSKLTRKIFFWVGIVILALIAIQLIMFLMIPLFI